MSLKFNKVEVNDKDVLDELYDSSALTKIGLSEDAIIDFLEWIKKYTEFTKEIPDVYIISGALMNKTYKLSTENSYSNNLTIVSIKLDQIKDVGTIIIPRFEVGGRWFDDIVDNNEERNK